MIYLGPGLNNARPEPFITVQLLLGREAGLREKKEKKKGDAAEIL